MLIRKDSICWDENLPACKVRPDPDTRCLGAGCTPAGMDDFCSSALMDGFLEIGFCNCICYGCSGAVVEAEEAEAAE